MYYLVVYKSQSILSHSILWKLRHRGVNKPGPKSLSKEETVLKVQPWQFSIELSAYTGNIKKAKY